jgi:hypothetical protein
VITGSQYLLRGRPVTVLAAWNGTRNPDLPRPRELLPLVSTRPNAPRNIGYLDESGVLVVRPFRGLRRPPEPAPVWEQLPLTEYRVAHVSDDHIAARPVGRRRLEYFDTRMVADWDAPIVEPGARFWLVAERVRGRAGEAHSAIAFRRAGALSPEAAFAIRRPAAPGVPTNPASPKGAS